MRRTGALMLAGLLLPGFLPAAAQEPPEATFKSTVKLVPLTINVKDANGELVGSLEKSDFTVYDCGVKQEIVNFEQQSKLPLMISVLIDTSASTLIDIRYETTSIQKFFKALLGSGNPKDMAAVFSFNQDVTVLRSFTRNAGQLNGSLRGLVSVGSTALYDAIVFASREVSDRDGRHVIVIVTDGGNTSSHFKFQDAIREAHLANAVIYPIVVVPISNDAGRNIGGENTLMQIAKDTGGRTFYPSVSQLDQTFADILKDLRRSYVLGYYPRGIPADAPAFHPVRVELSRPELRPTLRAGYYEVAAP